MKIFNIGHDEGGWDTYDAFVIVANNEEEVRLIAANKGADEGKNVWGFADVKTEGDYTGGKSEPFILLASFNAG